MQKYLTFVAAESLTSALQNPIDSQALAVAEEIMSSIRKGGKKELENISCRLGDWSSGTPLLYSREQLLQNLANVNGEIRMVLEDTVERIERFAERQRRSIEDFTLSTPGLRMGQRMVPVKTVACYAPGGRYPYPSSVLMTAVTAKVAGVENVWVASPRPTPVTLAAAALAGATGVLATGGAQAIAAFTFGCEEIPSCDIIVGPGNKFVTAAKYLASRWVGIDMLAGPSELLVVADDSAKPEFIAADLLAQAEHDPDARCILVSTNLAIINKVEAAIAEQLADLPTAAVAAAALTANGRATLVDSIGEAARIADRLAPEHLSLQLRDAEERAPLFHSYGSLFVGEMAAEALADYGCGPNHVLPTGGSARFASGLSVLTFLKARTWTQVTHRGEAARQFSDAMFLAQTERLEAHARSIRIRSI